MEVNQNRKPIKVNEDSFNIFPLSFVGMNEYKCEIKIFDSNNSLYSFLDSKQCLPENEDEIKNIKGIFLKNPLTIASTKDNLDIEVLSHECTHLSLYLMRKMDLLNQIPLSIDEDIDASEETLCYILSNSLNQIAAHLKANIEFINNL